MKKAKVVIQKLELRWRSHDTQHVRVWRSDWFGDQFEILGIAAFNELSRFAKMFGIPVIDYSNED